MIDANDLLDVESELGRIVMELKVSKDTGDVILAICNDFSLRKLITDEIIGRTDMTYISMRKTRICRRYYLKKKIRSWIPLFLFMG